MGGSLLKQPWCHCRAVLKSAVVGLWLLPSLVWAEPPDACIDLLQKPLRNDQIQPATELLEQVAQKQSSMDVANLLFRRWTALDAETELTEAEKQAWAKLEAEKGGADSLEAAMTVLDFTELWYSSRDTTQPLKDSDSISNVAEAGTLLDPAIASFLQLQKPESKKSLRRAVLDEVLTDETGERQRRLLYLQENIQFFFAALLPQVFSEESEAEAAFEILKEIAQSRQAAKVGQIETWDPRQPLLSEVANMVAVFRKAQILKLEGKNPELPEPAEILRSGLLKQLNRSDLKGLSLGELVRGLDKTLRETFKIEDAPFLTPEGVSVKPKVEEDKTAAHTKFLEAQRKAVEAYAESSQLKARRNFWPTTILKQAESAIRLSDAAFNMTKVFKSDEYLSDLSLVEWTKVADRGTGILPGRKSLEAGYYVQDTQSKLPSEKTYSNYEERLRHILVAQLDETTALSGPGITVSEKLAPLLKLSLQDAARLHFVSSRIKELNWEEILTTADREAILPNELVNLANQLMNFEARLRLEMGEQIRIEFKDAAQFKSESVRVTEKALELARLSPGISPFFYCENNGRAERPLSHQNLAKTMSLVDAQKYENNLLYPERGEGGWRYASAAAFEKRLNQCLSKNSNMQKSLVSKLEDEWKSHFGPLFKESQQKRLQELEAEVVSKQQELASSEEKLQGFVDKISKAADATERDRLMAERQKLFDSVVALRERLQALGLEKISIQSNIDNPKEQTMPESIRSLSIAQLEAALFLAQRYGLQEPIQSAEAWAKIFPGEEPSLANFISKMTRDDGAKTAELLEFVELSASTLGVFYDVWGQNWTQTEFLKSQQIEAAHKPSRILMGATPGGLRPFAIRQPSLLSLDRVRGLLMGQSGVIPLLTTIQRSRMAYAIGTNLQQGASPLQVKYIADQEAPLLKRLSQYGIADDENRARLMGEASHIIWAERAQMDKGFMSHRDKTEAKDRIREELQSLRHLLDPAWNHKSVSRGATDTHSLFYRNQIYLGNLNGSHGAWDSLAQSIFATLEAGENFDYNSWLSLVTEIIETQLDSSLDDQAAKARVAELMERWDVLIPRRMKAMIDRGGPAGFQKAIQDEVERSKKFSEDEAKRTQKYFLGFIPYGEPHQEPVISAKQAEDQLIWWSEGHAFDMSTPSTLGDLKAVLGQRELIQNIDGGDADVKAILEKRDFSKGGWLLYDLYRKKFPSESMASSLREFLVAQGIKRVEEKAQRNAESNQGAIPNSVLEDYQAVRRTIDEENKRLRDTYKEWKLETGFVRSEEAQPLVKSIPQNEADLREAQIIPKAFEAARTNFFRLSLYGALPWERALEMMFAPGSGPTPTAIREQFFPEYASDNGYFIGASSKDYSRSEKNQRIVDTDIYHLLQFAGIHVTESMAVMLNESAREDIITRPLRENSKEFFRSGKALFTSTEKKDATLLNRQELNLIMQNFVNDPDYRSLITVAVEADRGLPAVTREEFIRMIYSIEVDKRTPPEIQKSLSEKRLALERVSDEQWSAEGNPRFEQARDLRVFLSTLDTLFVQVGDRPGGLIGLVMAHQFPNQVKEILGEEVPAEIAGSFKRADRAKPLAAKLESILKSLKVTETEKVVSPLAQALALEEGMKYDSFLAKLKDFVEASVSDRGKREVESKFEAVMEFVRLPETRSALKDFRAVLTKGRSEEFKAWLEDPSWGQLDQSLRAADIFASLESQDPNAQAAVSAWILKNIQGENAPWYWNLAGIKNSDQFSQSGRFDSSLQKGFGALLDLGLKSNSSVLAKGRGDVTRRELLLESVFGVKWQDALKPKSYEAVQRSADAISAADDVTSHLMSLEELWTQGAAQRVSIDRQELIDKLSWVLNKSQSYWGEKINGVDQSRDFLRSFWTEVGLSSVKVSLSELESALNELKGPEGSAPLSLENFKAEARLALTEGEKRSFLLDRATLTKMAQEIIDREISNQRLLGRKRDDILRTQWESYLPPEIAQQMKTQGGLKSGQRLGDEVLMALQSAGVFSNEELLKKIEDAAIKATKSDSSFRSNELMKTEGVLTVEKTEAALAELLPYSNNLVGWNNSTLAKMPSVRHQLQIFRDLVASQKALVQIKAEVDSESSIDRLMAEQMGSVLSSLSQVGAVSKHYFKDDPNFVFQKMAKSLEMEVEGLAAVGAIGLERIKARERGFGGWAWNGVVQFGGMLGHGVRDIAGWGYKVGEAAYFDSIYLGMNMGMLSSDSYMKQLEYWGAHDHQGRFSWWDLREYSWAKKANMEDESNFYADLGGFGASTAFFLLSGGTSKAVEGVAGGMAARFGLFGRAMSFGGKALQGTARFASSRFMSAEAKAAAAQIAKTELKAASEAVAKEGVEAVGVQAAQQAKSRSSRLLSSLKETLTKPRAGLQAQPPVASMALQQTAGKTAEILKKSLQAGVRKPTFLEAVSGRVGMGVKSVGIPVAQNLVRSAFESVAFTGVTMAPFIFYYRDYLGKDAGEMWRNFGTDAVSTYPFFIAMGLYNGGLGRIGLGLRQMGMKRMMTPIRLGTAVPSIAIMHSITHGLGQAAGSYGYYWAHDPRLFAELHTDLKGEGYLDQAHPEKAMMLQSIANFQSQLLNYAFIMGTHKFGKIAVPVPGTGRSIRPLAALYPSMDAPLDLIKQQLRSETAAQIAAGVRPETLEYVRDIALGRVKVKEDFANLEENFINMVKDNFHRSPTADEVAGIKKLYEEAINGGIAEGLKFRQKLQSMTGKDRAEEISKLIRALPQKPEEQDAESFVTAIREMGLSEDLLTLRQVDQDQFRRAFERIQKGDVSDAELAGVADGALKFKSVKEWEALEEAILRLQLEKRSDAASNKDLNNLRQISRDPNARPEDRAAARELFEEEILSVLAQPGKSGVTYVARDDLGNSEFHFNEIRAHESDKVLGYEGIRRGALEGEVLSVNGERRLALQNLGLQIGFVTEGSAKRRGISRWDIRSDRIILENEIGGVAVIEKSEAGTVVRYRAPLTGQEIKYESVDEAVSVLSNFGVDVARLDKLPFQPLPAEPRFREGRMWASEDFGPLGKVQGEIIGEEWQGSVFLESGDKKNFNYIRIVRYPGDRSMKLELRTPNTDTGEIKKVTTLLLPPMTRRADPTGMGVPTYDMADGRTMQIFPEFGQVILRDRNGVSQFLDPNATHMDGVEPGGAVRTYMSEERRKDRLNDFGENFSVMSFDQLQALSFEAAQKRLMPSELQVADLYGRGHKLTRIQEALFSMFELGDPEAMSDGTDLKVFLDLIESRNFTGAHAHLNQQYKNLMKKIKTYGGPTQTTSREGAKRNYDFLRFWIDDPTNVRGLRELDEQGLHFIDNVDSRGEKAAQEKAEADRIQAELRRQAEDQP